MVLSRRQRKQVFGLWLASAATICSPVLALHMQQQPPSSSSWQPPKHWKFTGFRHRAPTTTTTTSHQSTFDDDRDDLYYGNNDAPAAGAIFPDGGLSPCVIKVIGVGGGGSNAVDRMLDTAVGGVDFWAINTDAQALGRSKAKGAKTLNIGASVTRGLGAGGNPDIGRMAAEESLAEIEAMVAGTDLCFVTSGMGGGTGSGACPVVAQIAKEQGCLTVGIVTKPFMFEGKRRMTQAIKAIDRLRENVDTVIVVSNDRLLEIIPDDTPIERAFAVADDILRQGVVGISDIIVKPGLINVDFADVRSIMSGAGTALMGIGIGNGKTAAEDAAAAAISSPLLDSTIENAKGVVFNISGGPNLSLNEVNQAAKLIYSTVEADANVIFGALVDETLEDNISITVLATGFKTKESEMGARARMSEPTQSTARSSMPSSDTSFNDVRGQAAGARRQSQQQSAQTARQSPPVQDDDLPPESGGEQLPSFLKNLKKKR
ncbi:protein FtsZ [Seminavis robusta]|uniref:Protein FtsZ n=1 Tax=Seminavis robusta TaxID=568900 RepID=A0A9N8D941_9STRA|nr:protein FtsZ [Seminavis robusta]|eukprot:Sro5_g004730.1 protein FtsZ (489) ;mRNA; f:238831-240401